MNEHALEDLREAVFSRQTVLADIYRKNSSLSIAEYARRWHIARPAAPDTFLMDELRPLAERLYGLDHARGIAEQLAAAPLVSTIDHHGIFNHPFFLNSNFIAGLRPAGRYLICLSTAGVSLNNSSWPGCLLATGESGRMVRFSFFRDAEKTQAVYAAPAIRPPRLETVVRAIRAAGMENSQWERLAGFAESIFDDRVLQLPDFKSQASAVSARIWYRVFPSLPMLIYIPVEELVAGALARIGEDRGHILHQLLFTERGWDLIEKYFQGSLGAFSAGHKGSFLFWGVRDNRRRAHLARRGSRLEDHGFLASLQDGEIAQGLRSGSLYPTSLVCFLVLLYYNITCLGGFNQVNWLTDIKNKFAALLIEIGRRDLAEAAGNMPTENFAESNLVFGIRGSRLYKPTAADLFLQPGNWEEKYRKLAERMTVGEGIDSLLPEIYRIITPADRRCSGLLDVADEQIIGWSGTLEKIRSCLV